MLYTSAIIDGIDARSGFRSTATVCAIVRPEVKSKPMKGICVRCSVLYGFDVSLTTVRFASIIERNAFRKTDRRTAGCELLYPGR